MRLHIKKICNDTIQQHIDRMHDLCEKGRARDAECIYSEIRDWVIQKENLEVLLLDYISGNFLDF
jgi:hypothetical protein